MRRFQNPHRERHTATGQATQLRAGSPNRPSERTLGHARISECEYYRREFWHERAILAEFPKVPTFSSISKPGKPAFLLAFRTALTFRPITTGCRPRFTSHRGLDGASRGEPAAASDAATGRLNRSDKSASGGPSRRGMAWHGVGAGGRGTDKKAWEQLSRVWTAQATAIHHAKRRIAVRIHGASDRDGTSR